MLECRYSKSSVSDGYWFVVRPNCALNRQTAKLVFLFFTACFGTLGMYFAALETWLVLPFAGFGLVVTGSQLLPECVCRLYRKVIEIEGPVLRVLRSGRLSSQLDSGRSAARSPRLVP